MHPGRRLFAIVFSTRLLIAVWADVGAILVDFDSLFIGFNFYGVVDRREPVFGKFGVKRGANDLSDLSDVRCGRSCCHVFVFLRSEWEANTFPVR